MPLVAVWEVVLQLRCLVCSWLLSLSLFPEPLASPALTWQIPAILVTAGTLLFAGVLPGCVFQAPLSTSLDSAPAFLPLPSRPLGCPCLRAAG